MKNRFLPLALFFTALAITSCSLKYEEGVNIEDKMPELVFTNADLIRYKDGKPSMELKAEEVEQYKDNGSTYARNPNFSTWDSEEKVDTTGSCGLLSINTKENIYTLFSDILINNASNDVEISAQNMRYNGNTKQLTAGLDEEFEIKREGLTLTGRGFSASGVSNSFAFNSGVEGTMITQDQEEEAEE
ncbi:MAG: LPS export ABC transporter periplasmic protein LptC [Treponema sp.]|nr:LPS export ABC transporter periplasmic protein LptC [Treponema sp.]